MRVRPPACSRGAPSGQPGSKPRLPAPGFALSTRTAASLGFPFRKHPRSRDVFGQVPPPEATFFPPCSASPWEFSQLHGSVLGLTLLPWGLGGLHPRSPLAGQCQRPPRSPFAPVWRLHGRERRTEKPPRSDSKNAAGGPARLPPPLPRGRSPPARLRAVLGAGREPRGGGRQGGGGGSSSPLTPPTEERCLLTPRILPPSRRAQLRFAEQKTKFRPRPAMSCLDVMYQVYGPPQAYFAAAYSPYPQVRAGCRVGGVSAGGWPSGASPKGKREKEKGRGRGGGEAPAACDGERSRAASHLGAGLGAVRTPAGRPGSGSAT